MLSASEGETLLGLWAGATPSIGSLSWMWGQARLPWSLVITSSHLSAISNHQHLMFVLFQGFLPESKFNHTLAEPVLRDVGPRRRGRRPRSELLKAPAIVADSPSGMGPLFMNGLIAGMDLVGLQNVRNMPGIPLTGLVGFPAGFATMPTGEEVKSTLSMLPMMLPGMAAVPQMFGVGGLLNTPMATTCTSPAPASLSSTTKSGTSATEKTAEDKPSSHDAKTDMVAEDKPGPSPFSDQSEPAITASSPVAFNPFLIPGVSPGLVYPSMFLSPGMGMADRKSVV